MIAGIRDNGQLDWPPFLVVEEKDERADLFSLGSRRSKRHLRRILAACFPWARSWSCPKSAACVIATNAARPDRREPPPGRRRHGWPTSAHATRKPPLRCCSRARRRRARTRTQLRRHHLPGIGRPTESGRQGGEGQEWCAFPPPSSTERFHHQLHHPRQSFFHRSKWPCGCPAGWERWS
jgi:hypothetical protein